jgi:hypothetical protein
MRSAPRWIAPGRPPSDTPHRTDLALQLLPLVAVQKPDAYDDWACRWLARWLTETTGTTIDHRAEGRSSAGRAAYEAE